MIRWYGAGVWPIREESQRLVFGDRARARSRKIFEKGKDVKCKRIKSFSVISTNRKAQRDNAEQALAAMYIKSMNGSTGCVPKNLQAEEKRLSHLVNGLNRAMFTIRYQSLEEPPATPDTMTTRTTPTELAAPNDTDYRLMSNCPMPIHNRLALLCAAAT